MPISPRAKRILAVTAASIILVVSILLVVIPLLLERWLNQYDLQSAFHEATGGSISAGAFELRVFPAPHLIVPAGKVNLPELVSGNWQEIKIHPAFKALLAGQIRFRKIRILRPDVQLRTTSLPQVHGQTAVAWGRLQTEHLRQRLGEAFHQMDGVLQWLMTHSPEARVRIRDGRLDWAGAPENAPPVFHDIDANLTLPPDALLIELDCKSSLMRALRLTGHLDAGAQGGELTFWFKDLDAEKISTAAGLKRPGDRIAGLLSGHMALNLKGPEKIESHLSFRLPRLLLQRLEKPLIVQNIFVDSNLTIDATKIKFDLDRLFAQQPNLNITGHAQAGGGVPGLRIHLVGSQIDVAEARQATLALIGDSENAVAIFDVLRAGNVPWISWRTEGISIGDLGVFRNMKLTGEMESGELYIPAADLPLTDVNGIADIVDGALSGMDVSARNLKTTGRKGKLWIDFEPDNIPFFLEIETEMKDVGSLPPRLIQWVDNAPLQEELKRLSRVQGEARGTMILDSRRGEGLEVTVDVVQCRLAADYDRVPWEIAIDQGQVQYTAGRIAVDQMQGRIGDSSFSTLKARVDFDHESRLHIDALQASVDLQTLIPWLASFEALAPLAKKYRTAGDKGAITSLKLHGPFFNPGRWDYRLTGNIDRLSLEADVLPGRLQFINTRLIADEKTLNIENTGLRLLDTDVTANGQSAFQDGQIQSFAVQFRGTVGHRVDKWLNDLFEADADRYLTQTPLKVSDTTFAWARGKPFRLSADFTTSKGVQVILTEEWRPKISRQGRYNFIDGDLRANVSLARESDQLAVAFEGSLSSNTLSRVFKTKHFRSGRLKGDFRAVILPRQPSRSTASGHLKVINVSLPPTMDHQIHLSQVHLTAEGNRLQIASAAFLVDNSWHTLEGEIKLAADRYHLNLQHEGAYYELPITEATPSDAKPNNLEKLLNQPIDGEIRSRLSALKWGDRRWIPLHTRTVLTPGRWTIAVDEAALCGIQTTGTVVLEPEKTTIDLQHEARDLALNSTMSCMLGKPDLIDGRFKLKGRLSGEAPLNELRRSLDGQFKFKAKDGRIYRFDILGRILAAINLTELVRGKKSDLMGEGLAYRRIDIKAKLDDGVLTLDEAVIDGASAEIAAEGELDLGRDEIDLIVLVAPLKTVDALIKFTPIINTWLEGTLVSIPVRVSGDIHDPLITPMSPTAVGSRLFNLLKNTVQLPIKLVEPLFEEDEDKADDADAPPE